MSDDQQDCVVAMSPCCKRAVFIAVNLPRVMDRKTKNEIARMAIAGYSIEHYTVAEARKLPFLCECKKDKP